MLIKSIALAIVLAFVAYWIGDFIFNILKDSGATMITVSDIASFKIGSPITGGLIGFFTGTIIFNKKRKL